MAYIYTAFIQYKDLFGRFANPTVTPTVAAYKSSDGTTISGATLTNIATGLYKASVSHTALEPVLFRAIPDDADKPSFEDVAVMASEVRFDVDDNFASIKGTGWSTETLKAIKEYVDGIEIKTNNLPANPAAAGEYTSTLSTINTTANGIKAKTDNLPDSPAMAGEYLSDFNEMGEILNDINLKTINLPASPANEDTLTAMKGAGWTDETLVALMLAVEGISSALDASPQDIWEYAIRTLTDASGLGLAMDTALSVTDSKVDAIKAKTDNLPTNPAVAGEYIEDFNDIEEIVDEINRKTLNLPDNPADQEVISNELNALPGKVWSNPTRTLTQIGTTVEYPAEGDPLIIYRDTTVAISLVNLGNIIGANKMWFTVKDNIEDVDSKSIIQIDTNGLQYINGAPAGSATVDGGIVINDPALGNISIFLKQEQAARLPLYEAYPTRWDVKVLKDGIVTILNIGSMYIKGTPTRAIL